MIKHVAIIAHKPEAGKWGDCFRASIASMLDIEEITDVPHFFDNGVDGETGLRHCDDWLSTRGMRLIVLGFGEILSFEAANSDMRDMVVPYLAIGETADGPHCVICYEGQLLHDVAIVRTPMISVACIILIGAKINV